ncbi:MAG TPA: Ig-like domain-containing protein, partial [Acidobacteriaceae bacterium]|nr:Ig-like domain-containing protein [Acidobacteriaceae bacterium]
LSANKGSILAGEAVTLSATLTTAGGSTASATGAVSFYSNGQLLGVAQFAGGRAIFTASSLADGIQSLTAVFSGTSGFGPSTSAAVIENVADVDLAINSPPSAGVEPGHSIAVPVLVQTTSAAGLTGNLTLTATNLPAGLTVFFAPSTAPLSSGTLPFTMSVTAAPATTGSAARSVTRSGIALALLLLPCFGLRRSSRLRSSRLLQLVLFMGCSLFPLALLSGCGGGTGFFAQKPQTYNINVQATATDSTGGTLTRNTTVSILVQ